MMFESSQSDGAANGGGFVSSQSAKSRDNQPMFPLTVKQISYATPATDDKPTFDIDGVEIYNVKLVGMVSDITKRVTDVSFMVDDFTGRIDCHRWVNDSYDTMQAESLVDGAYFCVHGHLKSFQGKMQMVVYAVRVIKDFNEIANHFIECMHAQRMSSKKQTQSTGVIPTSSASTFSNPGSHQAIPSTQLSQAYNLDGLGNTDKMILDYLQLPPIICQEKGAHLDEMAQTLKISKQKLQEAIESLESEGLVYSTVDEFHYKAT